MRKTSLIVGMVLALLVSGCATYNSIELTGVDGKPLGLTSHQVRQTGDFASWQYTSAITNKAGNVVSFATNGGKGFVDPLLQASGQVGMGYFIGSGLKNQDGDVVNQSQGQSQFQQQQQKLNTAPVLE